MWRKWSNHILGGGGGLYISVCFHGTFVNRFEQIVYLDIIINYRGVRTIVTSVGSFTPSMVL
jgi:hypothetical protein